MRVTSLDYNNYVGIIGVGRIQRGKVKTNQQVTVVDREGKTRNGKVLQVLGFMGLERVEVDEAAGRRHHRHLRHRRPRHLRHAVRSDAPSSSCRC